MAKNVIPGMKTGGGILSKLIGTAIVLALLVFVVKYPNEAADAATALFDGLGALVDGLAGVIRALVG